MSHIPAGTYKYLLPYEVIVITVRQHPILLVPSYVMAVGGLVAAWFASAWASAGWILVPIWAAAAFLLARSLFLTANWAVQFVVITEKRVMLKSGLLNPRVTTTPIQSLDNLTIEKSFGGNTFDYAALAIGETGERIIDYLPHPDQIFLEIRNVADPARPPDLDEDPSP
jgi:uncharacterized membrane protein YdbT with pleckstrin-like domain